MELKIIEFTGGDRYMTRRSALLFLIVFVLQVCTFTLKAYNWVFCFGLAAISTAWMLIFYRRYNVIGSIRLGNDSVCIAAGDGEKEIPLGELGTIALEYRNCWRSVGRFSNVSPNVITFHTKKGDTWKYQVLIEGNRSRRELKTLFEGYRRNGAQVDVVSRVNSTWQEF